MSRRRAGFTLIELVASALLAAMMMVALMNVVWSALRDTRQLKREDLSRSSAVLLAERLRTDFQNARGLSIQGGVVTLRGYLAEQLHSGAAAAGFCAVIHALMHQDNPSKRNSEKYGRTFRRYALFGREVGT